MDEIKREDGDGAGLTPPEPWSRRGTVAMDAFDPDDPAMPDPATPSDPTDEEIERLAGAQAAAPAEGDAGAEPPPLTDPGELAKVALALLLTAKESVSVLRLAQVCNATQDCVREALGLAEQQLRAGGLPLTVVLADDHARVLTLPEVFPYLQRMKGIRKAERLSPAALETLAVIAYRQPVLRAEIEAIRGVKAGPMLRTLLEHKLITITGRADVPGRPLQYGTTPQFLDRFGLGSLKDLPSVKELKALA
jgi:segregation and condensation protein B